MLFVENSKSTVLTWFTQILSALGPSNSLTHSPNFSSAFFFSSSLLVAASELLAAAAMLLLLSISLARGPSILSPLFFLFPLSSLFSHHRHQFSLSCWPLRVFFLSFSSSSEQQHRRRERGLCSVHGPPALAAPTCVFFLYFPHFLPPSSSPSPSLSLSSFFFSFSREAREKTRVAAGTLSLFLQRVSLCVLSLSSGRGAAAAAAAGPSR